MSYDYEFSPKDIFIDKHGYTFHARYDSENMIADYREFDKDGNEIFNIVLGNVDVYNTDDDIERLKYAKEYPGGYAKFHLCTTFALQKLLDMPFDDTYMLQATYGMKYRVLMNYAPCTFEMLKDRGYTHAGDFVDDSIWKDVSMKSILSERKKGRYFLMIRKKNPKINGSHVVAYIDGTLYSHSFERLRLDDIHKQIRKLVIDFHSFDEDYYLQAYMYKIDE